MKKLGIGAALSTLIFTGAACAQEPRSELGPCGLPDTAARDQVVAILVAPDLAPARERMGLSSVTPGLLRQLGDAPADASVCARLAAALPEGVHVRGTHAPASASFFEAGDVYVVTIRATAIAEPRPSPRGPDQTLSFTRSFAFVGGYAVR